MKKLFTAKLVIIVVFVFSFIVYFISSQGSTPYDYFTRLAESFLQGKYWLSNNPPWLNELIPAGINKFYVVYPPMPAILAMPFVLIFGSSFHQEYLAQLMGAGIVVLTMLLSWTVKKDRILAVWSGLFIGFGSIVWFLSSTGSVWYLGQISSAFFLLGAITIAIKKGSPFLTGLFIGAAYLSRTHTIVALPFFLYLFKDLLLRNWTKIFLGISPFLIFDAWYNFIRFGVPWNMGYFLLPKVLNEESAPWFYLGVANPSYILNNLKLAFWSFPKILNHFPYIQPSWAGMAIWITTPAFIFALFAPIKEAVVKFSWLSIFSIFLIVLSHGGTGSTQFGYRFAVDFYPFLIFLVIKAVSKTGLKWHHWMLLLFGIIVNLWGVLWINKFGWVSF